MLSFLSFCAPWKARHVDERDRLLSYFSNQTVSEFAGQGVRLSYLDAAPVKSPPCSANPSPSDYNSPNIVVLDGNQRSKNVRLVLVGVAHGHPHSVDEVRFAIRAYYPQMVMLEQCPKRLPPRLMKSAYGMAPVSVQAGMTNLMYQPTTSNLEQNDDSTTPGICEVDAAILEAQRLNATVLLGDRSERLTNFKLAFASIPDQFFRFAQRMKGSQSSDSALYPRLATVFAHQPSPSLPLLSSSPNGYSSYLQCASIIGSANTERCLQILKSLNQQSFRSFSFFRRSEAPYAAFLSLKPEDRQFMASSLLSLQYGLSKHLDERTQAQNFLHSPYYARMLITERDQFMVQQLRDAITTASLKLKDNGSQDEPESNRPSTTVVAVVGKAHVSGMTKLWESQPILSSTASSLSASRSLYARLRFERWITSQSGV